MHVAEAIDKLGVVVAGLTLAEATTERDKVEELATTDKLQNNIVDFLLTLTRVALHTAAYFDEANNIGVLKCCQGFALSVYQLLESFVRVDDLDGKAGIRAIFCELDLAGDAAAERSS